MEQGSLSSPQAWKYAEHRSSLSRRVVTRTPSSASTSGYLERRFYRSYPIATGSLLRWQRSASALLVRPSIDWAVSALESRSAQIVVAHRAKATARETALGPGLATRAFDTIVPCAPEIHRAKRGGQSVSTMAWPFVATHYPRPAIGGDPSEPPGRPSARHIGGDIVAIDPNWIGEGRCHACAATTSMAAVAVERRGGLSWLVLLFVIDLGFGHITLCVFHELCLSRLIAEAIGFAVDCGIDGVVGLDILAERKTYGAERTGRVAFRSLL
jgi:hypothetical protein